MDIKLLPVVAEDLEMIRTWRNSEEVAKYMYSEEEITPAQQENWFKYITDNPAVRVFVVEYNDKKVGLVSLTDISAKFDSCYMGFYIAEPSARGSGIGSKMFYNALTYVFETLGLNKLRGEVFATNEASIKLHEKFAFRREAFYRQHVKKGGIYYDVVGLALLREEWMPLKNVFYKNTYEK